MLLSPAGRDRRPSRERQMRNRQTDCRATHEEEAARARDLRSSQREFGRSTLEKSRDSCGDVRSLLRALASREQLWYRRSMEASEDPASNSGATKRTLLDALDILRLRRRSADAR